jgi:hypothetical protein
MAWCLVKHNDNFAFYLLTYIEGVWEQGAVENIWN